MRRFYSNFSKANRLIEGNVSTFLDFIRGISAILVVNEHLSSRLLAGYGNVHNPNLFIQFLYLLNMLGNPAVIIFFVLSGLFISRSVINSIMKEKWSWKAYIINRLSRLYVVLIPSLILTLILDGIAAKFFGFHGYDNIHSNIESFIGNLFFLQNIWVNCYGSNAPLWSLNYEFWYYILFPLIMVLLFRKQGKVVKITQVVLIAAIMLLIGTRINTYFLIWLMGALVLVLPKMKFFTGKFTPIFAIFLVITATFIHPLVMTGRLFTHNWTSDPYPVNLIISVFFSYLIYTLIHNKSIFIKKLEYKRFGKFSKLLSSFSFSLYLIHYPIINTLYYFAANNGFKGLQPSLGSVIIEIFAVVIICIIAFFFAKMTEANTHIVRNFLQTKMNAFIRNRNSMLNKQKKIW